MENYKISAGKCHLYSWMLQEAFDLLVQVKKILLWISDRCPQQWLFLGKEIHRMEIFYLRDSEDHIKLGQALKAAGLVESGADVEYVIADKNVQVTAGKELKGTDTFPVYIGKNQKV